MKVKMDCQKSKLIKCVELNQTILQLCVNIVFTRTLYLRVKANSILEQFNIKSKIQKEQQYLLLSLPLFHLTNTTCCRYTADIAVCIIHTNNFSFSPFHPTKTT